MQEEIKAMHLVFEGRVQGVGFRYTAQSLAERLGIKGWVKNLVDGRVELFAEAQQRLLDKFLADLLSFIKSHIYNHSAEDAQPQSLSSFRIIF